MKRLSLAVAVLALTVFIPHTRPADAGSEPVLKPCGTELTAHDIAEFNRRAANPRTGFIPQGAADPPYCIPIAAHIVRRSDGTGGLSQAQLDQGIADANAMYTNTGMVFQLLSVDYIDDDDYFNNINTSAEIDAMLGENVVAEAVNCYFTENLSNEQGGLCGRGSFTTSSPQGIAMSNDCMGVATNPSSFPHELGHYFDLFHTHETDFGAELVDGTNCGTAGDKLCDTPADPTIDPGTNADFFPSCAYTGSETDANGDSYNPDVNQLMSYSDKECRTVMSPQSEAKVVATLLNERPELLNKGCAPTANAGTDIVAECEGATTTVQLDGTGSSDPEGAVLTYTWEAAGITFDDDNSAEPTGEFPYGDTTVKLTISDGTYTRTDEVKVTVTDTTGPSITCPDAITVECVDHCGTPANDAQLTAFFAGVSALDGCGSVDITHNAPTCFPEGETTVTFSAEDDHDNVSTCQVVVTVEDTTPPEITVVLDRDALWPPNHKMTQVCATSVVVTDVCDDAPTFVLQEINSDEAADDIADGDTEEDWDGEFETPDLCFSLRSERRGDGDGRVYEIVYRAEDGSGNEAYATVYVTVGHNTPAAAAAANGFDELGSDFVADAFNVVILSTPEIDATALDASRIYVGNTAGAIRPNETRALDVNSDGRDDLAAQFPSATVLSYRPSVININDGALQKPISDGPIGLHFVTADGGDYLVGDIFALGEPVQLPGFTPEHPPIPFAEREETRAITSTGFTSIHPNPFNPQTTVKFALTSPQHVRVAIFDVRGSLVRRLADQSMPSGEHSLVWNGLDDRGATTSSGIYFVRLIAGSTVETRKVVMLK